MAAPIKGVAKKLVNSYSGAKILSKAIASAKNNRGIEEFEYDNKKYRVKIINKC